MSALDFPGTKLRKLKGWECEVVTKMGAWDEEEGESSVVNVRCTGWSARGGERAEPLNDVPSLKSDQD